MSETEFRYGKKRFYDNKKFPRGFAKSGDFTLAEEELLIQFGETMSQLESGVLEPVNTDERRFLLVLEQPEKATTKLERVWLKYVRLARGRKRFHTLNGRNKPDALDEFVDDSDIETES
ncbi:DUF413 domain-containing protein [Vibrio ruber]|uniref:DUF413 domain-containing protein n=1 Tax=Vibrio ruber TaxID=184755 RepID=UPI002892FA1A|nr:DUF413 domain-containing protein [Vibrio ruber]WNJ97972.1 DUF413 domain-containing protein [Vibrio ruber]